MPFEAWGVTPLCVKFLNLCGGSFFLLKFVVTINGSTAFLRNRNSKPILKDLLRKSLSKCIRFVLEFVFAGPIRNDGSDRVVDSVINSNEGGRLAVVAQQAI
ncbi:hypothetical protein CEXT_757741 [Caerostris extrusa]|uniref:Uncharacterized protein n=1 Tax=Caerostris extrusa TaxID=172846 RepID=A0AAV4P8Q8_CAEEX|nr:hypothetical protein CEXT_757741 [Caerostris extrusa]